MTDELIALGCSCIKVEWRLRDRSIVVPFIISKLVSPLVSFCDERWWLFFVFEVEEFHSRIVSEFWGSIGFFEILWKPKVGISSRPLVFESDRILQELHEIRSDFYRKVVGIRLLIILSDCHSRIRSDSSERIQPDSNTRDPGVGPQPGFQRYSYGILMKSDRIRLWDSISWEIPRN
jgi:hypothetical protein